MPFIAYQLYSSRNFAPIADTLSMLSEAGYEAVEGYGGLFGNPGDLRRKLDQNELRMTSGHFGLADLEKKPKSAIECAKTLGIEMVFAPFIEPHERPVDRAGWDAFAARLAEAGKPFEDAGLIFGWHNHDFELAELGNQIFPLDLIAEISPDMKLELDLGWVMRSGHDPIKWIQKHASKIAAVHIKDVAAPGTCLDEDGWADVGHGNIEWPPIMQALDQFGINHYVVEHDNPNNDRRFATRSVSALKSMLEKSQ